MDKRRKIDQTPRMRAIQVTAWDSPPKLTTEAAKPDPPPADSDLIQIKILATGLHRVVRSQADGSALHVKSAKLPYILGVDGVGITVDGTMVFFSCVSTGGSFAEYINVSKRACIPLASSSGSDKGQSQAQTAVNPSQVAALVNAGITSWMVLRTMIDRDILTRPVGFNVLILGVASIPGQVAVSIARYLGASKVMGLVDDVKAMQSLNLDETIELHNPIDKTDFNSSAPSFASVDIILDYLYGPITVHCLNSLPVTTQTVQYIQIASRAGEEINISAVLLRTKNVALRGVAWTNDQLGLEFPRLVKTVTQLPKFDIKKRKLKEVDVAWKEINEWSVFVL